MKTIATMDVYKSNIDIFDTDGDNHVINTDCKGEFTKEQWLEDETILQFDEESRNKIISALETQEIIKS